MNRRTFLRVCAGSAAGVALLPATLLGQGSSPSPKLKRSGRSDTLFAEIEKLVPKLLRETHVPGASMAIVRDGKLVWRRAFGVRDHESNKPVNNETVFEAASISKTVFAYMVMKLCEKGWLDLDTPLSKYTKSRFLDSDPRVEQITARHVLSHTTGFPDWRSNDRPIKTYFAPGSQFDYSGEGYYYLQTVVSQLVGHINPQITSRYESDVEVCATDIDDTIRSRVLRPLGMKSSGYLWNPQLAANFARPHDLDGKPLHKAEPTATDAARYASAGGLHTTATDYAKFLLEVITPKPSNSFRLTLASRNEMLRPQIKLPKGMEIDGATSWALGWAIQERPTCNVIVHSGGQTGFRSLTMASVERKSGFIILTNSDKGGYICYDPKLVELLNPLLTS